MTDRKDLDLDPRISPEHYGHALNRTLRFNTYRFAVDGRDIHQEVLGALALEPGQVLLDVGCSNGDFLIDARETYEPSRLIGLDIEDSLNEASLRENPVTKTEPEIELIIGSATEIDLPDNSVDRLTALFMLYHVTDLAQALREFQRVLKPDGIFIAATSGVNNKQKHRKFEHEIAKELGVGPPPRLAAPFSSDVARIILPQFFEVEEGEPQITEMRFDEHTIIEYLFSIDTMRSEFRPYPKSGFSEAQAKVVEQQTKQEIAEKGYFADTIERSFFICRQVSR